MHNADPVELLRRLIRFDTSNPPGRERECVMFINELLRNAGVATTIVARDPERPNLIARIPGQGTAPALLLQGHVDVVPVTAQQWTHPPFDAVVADGFVWGRGALDMKGGVAMMLTAFLHAAAAPAPPMGDLVLAILSDEENGSDYGAAYVVREHAALLAGVRHAIGEFGGFTFQFGGKRFYPIQVAEKQACRVRARLRGPSGHASLVHRDGAMARLAAMLGALNGKRLPVHVSSAARMMLTAIGDALGFPAGMVFRGLVRPGLTDRLLNRLGQRGLLFDALLHNTANATMVRGGETINMIPAEVVVDIDARLVPGSSPEELLAELRALVGGDVEFEVTRFDPAPPEPDMTLFPILASVLREQDPQGIPIPYLLAAVTDGRFFSRLGIQTYGFTPMTLPADFNFSSTIHAADERVPVAALEFGAHAVREVVRRVQHRAA